jgi:BirA family biotin operon repressor/biotin-[acetyl-CoA-carboxylase] ligase
MGRSFYSPDKTGLYMTLLLPVDCVEAESVRATTAAAVAVHECIEESVGITTQIKWVNDLYLDCKKVCGILCESTANDLGEKYIIIGIGINLSTRDFPDGLRAPAGSVLDTSITLTDTLIKNMALDISDRIIEKLKSDSRAHDLDVYRRHSYLDGKRVCCNVGSNTFCGKAIGIGDDFSLTVLTDSGDQISLGSGEASVKTENGEI